MKLKIGLDIGGTKCAISTGECEDGAIKILSREEFPTAGLSWQQVLEEFACRIERIVSSNSNSDLQLSAIGISCGGPLDSKRGVIMSPPNLPGWDDVPVVKFFEDRFHVPTAVQNDANACALAEYLYGSGRGVKNLVFMTFGTGLGAGIVIDGKLYSGANDNAGEIGHIRLAPTGPVGYNKEGSAEGFCSGAGIARLAKIRKGLDITTKELFARVRAGDPDCTEVFRESRHPQSRGDCARRRVYAQRRSVHADSRPDPQPRGPAACEEGLPDCSGGTWREHRRLCRACGGGVLVVSC